MDCGPVMDFLSRSIACVLKFTLSSLTVADFVIFQILNLLIPGYDAVEDRPLYIQDDDEEERAPSPSPGTSRQVKKRIKLLLDVDIDGSDEANITTATEYTPPPPTSSFFLIRWNVLWFQTVRGILKYIRDSIEAFVKVEVKNSEGQTPAAPVPGPSGTSKDEAQLSERKTKWVRKRLGVAASASSAVPLKLKGYFETATPNEVSTVIFEMPSAEDLLQLKNGKASESRTQAEKRKLSTSSNESLTPTNASVETESDGTTSEVVPPLEPLPVFSESGLPLKRSVHRSNLAAFMRESDENYESSEDPNFSPNEEDLNASSSTNETFDEEERIEAVKKSNGENGNGNAYISDDDVIIEDEEEEEEIPPAKVKIDTLTDPTRPDKLPEPEPCPQPDSDDEDDNEDNLTPAAAAAALPVPSPKKASGQGKGASPSTSKSPGGRRSLSKAQTSPNSSTNGKDDLQCQSPSSDSSYDDDLLFFESSSNLTPCSRTGSEGQDSVSQASSPFSYYSSRSPNSSSSSSSSCSSTFIEAPGPMQDQE